MSRRPSRSRIRCLSDGSWLTALSSQTGSAMPSSPVNTFSSIMREDQRGGADLEVGGDLGEVGVADDDVQPAVLVGVGVRLVAGVDDRPLEGGLEADLDLEEVGARGDLEAGAGAVLADADPADAGEDLPGDEERGQVRDDVGERGLPAHQVVLVRPVRCALVVGVVLVELDAVGAGDGRGAAGGLGHDAFAGLVPADDVQRVGAFGRAVLRVRVVDVEAWRRWSVLRSPGRGPRRRARPPGRRRRRSR